LTIHSTESPLRRALRALPAAEPPADGWARLRRSLDAHSRRRRRMTQFAVAATLVAAVSLAAWSPRPAPRLDTPAATPHEVAELMLRSRQLEQEWSNLRSFYTRDSRLDSRSQALESGLQVVDLQLSYASRDKDPEQLRRLWRNRVELMSALVRAQKQNPPPEPRLAVAAETLL
jgi:hypothetical protein